MYAKIIIYLAIFSMGLSIFCVVMMLFLMKNLYEAIDDYVYDLNNNLEDFTLFVTDVDKHIKDMNDTLFHYELCNQTLEKNNKEFKLMQNEHQLMFQSQLNIIKEYDRIYKASEV